MPVSLPSIRACLMKWQLIWRSINVNRRALHLRLALFTTTPALHALQHACSSSGHASPTASSAEQQGGGWRRIY